MSIRREASRLFFMERDYLPEQDLTEEEYMQMHNSYIRRLWGTTEKSDIGFDELFEAKERRDING